MYAIIGAQCGLAAGGTAAAYDVHKEPTDAFIDEFCKKHQVSLPTDLFFDMSDLFGF